MSLKTQAQHWEGGSAGTTGPREKRALERAQETGGGALEHPSSSGDRDCHMSRNSTGESGGLPVGERSFSCFLESDSLVFKGLCQCYAVHGLQDMETVLGWRAGCDGAAILSPARQRGSCGLLPVYTFWLQENRMGGQSWCP